jgi:hypothetical protein
MLDAQGLARLVEQGGDGVGCSREPAGAGGASALRGD